MRVATVGWGLIVALSMLAACVPPPAPMNTSPAPAASVLVARNTMSPPGLTEDLDPAWDHALPLRVPLAWGSHGTEHALDIELAALYTDDALYLRARWPAALPNAAPAGAAETTENRLTFHWSIPSVPDAPPPACDVVCHTVHTDGAGRLAYVHTETIPPGGHPALAATGGWRDGLWTLAWRRPLVSLNAYDLQLTDPTQSYPFFVKVFLNEEGRPDAVSKLHELVFER